MTEPWARRLPVAAIAIMLAATMTTPDPTFAAAAPAAVATAATAAPVRPRQAGIRFGTLPTGPLNSITDVAGVLVGHATLVEGTRVHTGVTAILPHSGNLFQDKVPAGFAVANGFGKFVGSTQIIELGEIETPVMLTNTLSVPEAAAAAIAWTLAMPGNETVRSVNAVVGETNDGTLNDIRARQVTMETALAAIGDARSGAVAEGAVGAGAGTVAFGWKGGIGTSSRRLPETAGGYTVGVLVQSNFGGDLTIAGVPVGQRLGAPSATASQRDDQPGMQQAPGDGSIVIVVATDAPLSDRNLRRLASRTFLGVGRTGSVISNGSGDYALAFSVHPDVRRTAERRRQTASTPDVGNDQMSGLFAAVVEATEEAIINSLFAATTVEGHRATIPALPVARVLAIMKEAGRLQP